MGQFPYPIWLKIAAYATQRTLDWLSSSHFPGYLWLFSTSWPLWLVAQKRRGEVDEIETVVTDQSATFRIFFVPCGVD